MYLKRYEHLNKPVCCLLSGKVIWIFVCLWYIWVWKITSRIWQPYIWSACGFVLVVWKKVFVLKLKGYTQGPSIVHRMMIPLKVLMNANSMVGFKLIVFVTTNEILRIQLTRNTEEFFVCYKRRAPFFTQQKEKKHKFILLYYCNCETI